MTKLHLTAVIIPLLILSFVIITGCSKQPEVIMAVPFCDCNYNPEDSQANCWEGYVCDADAACSHDGGLFDRCVPQDLVEPHDHGTSY